MDHRGVLIDGFERVKETVHATLDGLSDEAMTARLDPEANTIAWLIWHMARVQDDHVAGVAGSEQVYTSAGFASRFGLPFDDGDIGYGQSSDDVAEVTPPAALLLEYVDAVHDRTAQYLGGVSAEDLDRVVDDNWDPPVTLAVRLVSVLSDDLQHVGQAAYVRGVLERR
ncbi:mycothiol transferase [Rhodococcoides corynebacterioides]|uniref:mycothiol transferase n=1 Tax=Rhodococcoides corynebacterioides TaxID=53972 RepID=UPI001C9BB4B9|nr:DUF664 domain-containing protein [Rhodococcus corynebacterioides]MBY6365052.1 DUF664 domain-containing protein [Rhodococcus corynebacterioides]